MRARRLRPRLPAATRRVANYSGLGVHTILSVIRHFPGHFKNLVFLSVGVVDSGTFKGAEELAELRTGIRRSLDRYVALAQRLGFAAEGRMRMGTDRLDEAEAMCSEVLRAMPRTVFFAGRLVFRRGSDGVRRAKGGAAVTEGALVLVVDDDLSIRGFLRIALGGRGCCTAEGACGAEAIEKVAALRPDLLVIDLGADDYLTRPFGTEELLAPLRVALRHAQRLGTETPVVFRSGERSSASRRGPTTCSPSRGSATASSRRRGRLRGPNGGGDLTLVRRCTIRHA